MTSLPALLLAVALSAACLKAVQPTVDVYVSTGDNHYLGSSLPIDSPASIEASFDLFREVNHARRIYWRGLEASCWLATMQARPENPRYFSFFEWLRELYATVNPDLLAVKAARSRGMEIWGMGSLFDWGSSMDTPGFNDYPFAFESSLRLEHPEWAPVNRQGTRHQGGPIELAYPQARKALVDLTLKETLKAGYQGIALLTYVENYSLRFQDEFGFSDPIVEDFRRLYKVDLRREPFKRGASREDWLRLRGSYVTAFLRELKAALSKHGIKLGVVVNSNDPRLPQSWNVPELMLTAGAMQMDVETWVRESLVDELIVYGNNSGPSQLKALDDLRFLTRGTPTKVSVMTSGPFREVWRPYQQAGVATVLAVSDDVQHLERGFLPPQDAAAMESAEPSQRQRALQQSITGDLSLGQAVLLRSAKSPNLIERRLALQALGKLSDAPLQPLLDGLLDPENGVRCMAALGLAQRRDPAACAALLDAAKRHGNHMLRECIVIALRRLTPFPSEALGRAAQHSGSDQVREVAMRALWVDATSAQLPVLLAGLKDKARFVRFAAAEALGNLAKDLGAIEGLIQALAHPDAVVVNRAAVSLGQLGALKNTVSESSRPRILAALLKAFKGHSDPKRDDAQWGWRPIGNALLELGDEGRKALLELRDQPQDPRLAELAWRVVDLRQRKGSFSEVSAEEDLAAHARRPSATVLAGLVRDLQVDPVRGSDANDGRSAPVKTIARAVKLAQPGDTVHLAAATYFESADLSNKHGRPGEPITLDGHGAVLDGSEPVRAAEWESLGQDLYRKVKLMPRMDDAIRVRWFFLWNGRMNRMGLCSKGPSLPLKKPSELKADEWTYVQAEDAFYLKLPAGLPLDKANIRYPKRSSALIESGTGSWLTVRNLTGTHVYNDGFNIHGAQRHTVFENIAAIECGDDGFSAHEDADCQINGFTSIGNATGLCDTGTSQTHYRNVLIRGCHGYDLYFIGLRHSMENAHIESSAARAFMLDGSHLKEGGSCQLSLKNVLIRRVGGGPQEMRLGQGASLQAERCSFLNLNVTMTPGAAIELRHCVIGGDPKPEVLCYANTVWRGDGNVYDLGSLRVGKVSFTAASFAEFQKHSGSERNSRWQSLLSLPAGTGADETVPRSSPQRAGR